MDKIEQGIVDAYTIAEAAVPKSVVDVAGDLVVGTGADTVVGFAKGAEGDVLSIKAGVLDLGTGCCGRRRFGRPCLQRRLACEHPVHGWRHRCSPGRRVHGGQAHHCGADTVDRNARRTKLLRADTALACC